jgi:hypothetical protein
MVEQKKEVPLTSNTPRITRHATRPWKFCTTPMQVMTVPQQITKNDSQMLALTFFKTILEGTSIVYQHVSPNFLVRTYRK